MNTRHITIKVIEIIKNDEWCAKTKMRLEIKETISSIVDKKAPVYNKRLRKDKTKKQQVKKYLDFGHLG